MRMNDRKFNQAVRGTRFVPFQMERWTGWHMTDVKGRAVRCQCMRGLLISHRCSQRLQSPLIGKIKTLKSLGRYNKRYIPVWQQ